MSLTFIQELFHLGFVYSLAQVLAHTHFYYFPYPYCQVVSNSSDAAFKIKNLIIIVDCLLFLVLLYLICLPTQITYYWLAYVYFLSNFTSLLSMSYYYPHLFLSMLTTTSSYCTCYFHQTYTTTKTIDYFLATKKQNLHRRVIHDSTFQLHQKSTLTYYKNSGFFTIRSVSLILLNLSLILHMSEDFQSNAYFYSY